MNMKNMNEDLTLTGLLTRCKELPPNDIIRIYIDLDSQYFIINFGGTLSLWLPRSAIMIGKCEAINVESEIVNLIAYAAKKLTEEPKSEP